MIRLNRGVKGMGVCFGIYTMYFTLGRNSRMIARSGKKYKSQPVSEESNYGGCSKNADGGSAETRAGVNDSAGSGGVTAQRRAGTKSG